MDKDSNDKRRAVVENTASAKIEKLIFSLANVLRVNESAVVYSRDNEKLNNLSITLEDDVAPSLP